jgi:plastocyanin
MPITARSVLRLTLGVASLALAGSSGALAVEKDPVVMIDNFTFRFDQPGTYTYFCKLHPHMHGTIEVTSANG